MPLWGSCSVPGEMWSSPDACISYSFEGLSCIFMPPQPLDHSTGTWLCAGAKVVCGHQVVFHQKILCRCCCLRCMPTDLCQGYLLEALHHCCHALTLSSGEACLGNKSTCAARKATYSRCSCMPQFSQKCSEHLPSLPGAGSGLLPSLNSGTHPTATPAQRQHAAIWHVSVN